MKALLNSFLDLAGTDAGRADVFSADFAVNKYPYAPDVGVEDSACCSVGMADRLASYRFFSADRALK